MPAIDTITSAAADDDYRSSHVASGDTYDARLADSPFDNYMAAWEQRLLPGLIRRFYPDGIDRYLDFACGTGRITQQIAPLAKHSTAVDISPGMLEQARAKCPDTRFLVADLTQDSIDIGQFDLASAFRFFGNAQDELREGALGAIVRRLAPGGHLLINSHRNPRAFYAVFEKMTGGTAMAGMDLTLPKLRGLLERHGLEIVALRPIGAWMYRTRIMLTTQPDAPRALRNEALFSSPLFGPIAPDALIVARKR
ncbi:MAG: methyltransferase domain-containing protein [Proteobacteria bacterium]|nr:methyltransferase domain-containing protein [Pseudomonadota bacterium]